MFFVKTISINLVIWMLRISYLIFPSKSEHVPLYERRLYKTLRESYLPSDENREEISDRYFEQKLDHFNPINEETWLQRYWRNSKYYTGNGPAFLIIQGEGNGMVDWVLGGQWVSYAKIFNADIFSLEHRFYGQSVPKNDTSTQNLIYLSSDQALADIAYFIRGASEKYAKPDNTKWIVFGCSYAGTLAAWARLKYPYLIYGAVSSSAPLLAKVDFPEFYQALESTLDLYNPKCSSKIAEANEQLDRLIKTKEGRKHASRLFQLYDLLDNTTEDAVSLFDRLAFNFAAVVQNNRGDQKPSIVTAIYPPTIETLCDIMTYPNVSALDLYAAVNIFFLKHNGWISLHHGYNELVDRLKNTDTFDGSRQWNYQLCTEFGFHQTSSDASEMFGTHIPSKHFTKLCQEIFGQEFNETRLNRGVYRTNTIYGGLKINVGNIIFVHGSIDPWRVLGVTSAENKTAPHEVVLINGTAHCGDINPHEKGDLDSLKEAQNRIQTILSSWIQNE